MKEISIDTKLNVLMILTVVFGCTAIVGMHNAIQVSYQNGLEDGKAWANNNIIYENRTIINDSGLPPMAYTIWSHQLNSTEYEYYWEQVFNTTNPNITDDRIYFLLVTCVQVVSTETIDYSDWSINASLILPDNQPRHHVYGGIEVDVEGLIWQDAGLARHEKITYPDSNKTYSFIGKGAVWCGLMGYTIEEAHPLSWLGILSYQVSYIGDES